MSKNKKREELKGKINHLSAEKLSMVEELFAELSTDESEGNSEEKSSKIQRLSKEISDKTFSNPEFLNALRSKNFLQVSNLLNPTLKFNNDYTDLLKKISYSIKDVNIQEDIKTNIFVTATDELMLLGEDVTDIMEYYYSE